MCQGRGSRTFTYRVYETIRSLGDFVLDPVLLDMEELASLGFTHPGSSGKEWVEQPLQRALR